MGKPKKVTLVGGEYHGTTHTILYGNRLRLMQREPLPTTVFHSHDHDPMASAPMKFIDYAERVVYPPHVGKGVCVWAPEQWTDEQVIGALEP